MKNSTLLRLFFISIGLPLTCASSPSTSSALTSKKPKIASMLVDKTNVAPAVQLKGQSILIQSVRESQVSEKDEQTKEFEELINKGQYEEMVKLSEKMSDKELLKCLFKVVTTLDHFKDLYEYLKPLGVVPRFLAHGEMALVREVIFETDLLETGYFGNCDNIYDAIALSLEENCHDRVASLFEAAHGRPAWKKKFDVFVSRFFMRHPSKRGRVPFRRFLTLHGEELNKKHFIILETICEELVGWSIPTLRNPVSQKLLIDLVGQPSLLTPVAFAKGFLGYSSDISRVNFVKFGYKEAIEEGLKKEYSEGGRKLWGIMVSKYSDQFSGEYPSTDEARTAALKDFKPTKQDLEGEWAERNASILLRHLETLVTELRIAKVLLPIIAEYAITWILV